MKSRAFSFFGNSKYDALVMLSDLVYKCQSNASSFIFSTSIHPLKDLEYFFGILLCKPYTVIAYNGFIIINCLVQMSDLHHYKY